MPQPVMLKKPKLNSSMKTYKTFQSRHPKKMSFSLQGTGMKKQEVKKYLKQQANLVLEYRMMQGKGYQSSARRTHWSQQTPSSNNTREDYTHVHHQTVNTEIRLSIFFKPKMDKLYQFISVQSLSCVRLFATHESQHARPPCPSPTPGVDPNPCPLSQ